MQYRKISLAQFPFLSQYVFDIYVLTNEVEETVYSTVPNGIIGISVVLSGEHHILSEGMWHQSAPITIYGLINKPDVIRISGGFREVAIGFKPYFLQLLVKSSMSDIVGGINTDAFDFFSKDDLNSFCDALHAAKSDSEILASASTFLRKQLSETKEHKRLEYAMESIYRNRAISVSELSSALNLSTVSLRNLFRHGIGQSPKEVIRILRINRALNSKPDAYGNLAQMGCDLGYFDQSHFIHDFKKSFVFSPGFYFSHSDLSFDFYNFGRWRGNIFERNSNP